MNATRNQNVRAGAWLARFRNARFWIWENGAAIKLTLLPGQILTWRRRCPTDEGWALELRTWEHEGYSVAEYSLADGRDCDGRLTSTAHSYCPLRNLHADIVDPDDEAIVYPAWHASTASQRDFQAELSDECYGEERRLLAAWAAQQPDCVDGEDERAYWLRIGGPFLDAWREVAQARIVAQD